MKQRININMIPNGVAQVIHLSQNDYLNGELEFYLFHGSSVLTDGIANAMIKGLKPDNNIFLYNATSINGNVVTFNVTEQMTAVAGKVDCKLRIQTADGAKHSKAFILDCEADPTTNGNVSESVIDALEELIEQVTEDAAEAQAAAESAEEDADRAEQAADDLIAIKTSTKGIIATTYDAKAGNLLQFKGNLEPVQNLNGYDHPWAGGAGKNKIDYTKRAFGTTGTIVVLGQTVGYGTPSVPMKAGTYTFSVNFASGASAIGYMKKEGQTNNTKLWDAGGNHATFTLDSDTLCSFWVFNGDGISDEQVLSGQVEAGTEATSHEPYENICPIVGTDSVTVMRAGKNVLSGITFENGYINETGVEKTSANTMRTAEYIPCISGKYSIKFHYAEGASATRIRVHEYDAERNWVRQVYATESPIPITEEPTEITWTSTSDAVYFRFSVGVFDEIECRENVESFPITLPSEAGTVYGGVVTVNSDGSGQLVVNRKRVNLSSEMTWTGTGTISAQNIRRYTNFADHAPATDGWTYTDILCSHFIYENGNVGAWGTFNYTFAGNFSVKDMYGFNPTKQDFLDWLDAQITAGTPVQVVYPIVPVTYSLTAAQVVQMFSGDNAVWMDASGTLQITYKTESALSDMQQDIVDLQDAVSDIGDTVDDLSAEVVRKEDITQSGTVTTAGQYAVDARQLNPTISGTIAKRVTDLEGGVVLKSALSRSTSVTSTKQYAVDAYELNASKGGTLARKISDNTTALGGFKFGMTSDTPPRPGYIMPGADTVIPFKSGESVEDIVTTDLIFTYTGGGSGEDMQQSVNGTIIAAGTVSIAATVDYITSETRSGWPSISFSGSTVTLHHVHTFGTTVTATVRVWYLPTE